MNNHVTNNELASYLADTILPRERDRVDSHVRECETCRNKLEKVKIALMPRFQSVELRDETIARILNSWDTIQAESARGGVISFLRKYPKAAAASALAAAAAIIIIVSLLLNVPREPAGVDFALGRAEGTITVNGDKVRAGDKVHGGSTITSPDKGMARLVYGDTINIDLISRCDFSVDDFTIDRADTVRLANSLRSGIVLSSIHDSNRKVHYVYATPNARIESLGTEFLLQAEGGTTLVIMKTDAIQATHLTTGKSVIVPAGKKCLISDSLDIMAATDEEMKMLEDLEGLRKGNYGHLLLPAISGRKSGMRAGTAAQGDTDLKTGGTAKSEGTGAGDKLREGDADRQDARRERDREIRQQRMEQKKLQMNEMRRNTRTNANQQMRRGR